jgi:hypothetical protein
MDYKHTRTHVYFANMYCDCSLACLFCVHAFFSFFFSFFLLVRDHPILGCPVYATSSAHPRFIRPSLTSSDSESSSSSSSSSTANNFFSPFIADACTSVLRVNDDTYRQEMENQVNSDFELTVTRTITNNNNSNHITHFRLLLRVLFIFHFLFCQGSLNSSLWKCVLCLPDTKENNKK